MPIATKEEYKRKLKDFDSRKANLDRAVNDLWTVPCMQLSTECFDDIWKRVGCDQKQPYTEENTRGMSFYDLIDDAYKWSTFSDDDHPKIGCYKNPNAVKNTKPKDYRMSVLDDMSTADGMTFVKNGQGVDARSVYDCTQLCLRKEDCKTATFNSIQGKCWTNDILAWYDYVDYTPSNVEGDVAIYNNLMRETKQLYDLNEELAEYDMRVNKIQFGPIFQPGSGIGYEVQGGRKSGDGRGSGSIIGGEDGQTSMVTTSAPANKTENGREPSGLQNVLNQISAISQTIASLAGDFTDTKQNISSITNDYKDIKQKVTTIDTDRAAIAKTLEDYNKKLIELSNKQEVTNATFKKQEESNTAALVEYKKQLTDMSEKQEDSNDALKKQLITIVIIAVVGILLIFFMAAVVQSLGSSNENSFSGGGAKKCCSNANLKVFPFNSIPLKQIFGKIFKK